MVSPHQGIDLDVINLNEYSRLPGLETASPSVSAQDIDYKDFIKEILRKVLGNESFLSFSRQITDVNRILSMKYSSADDIARVILKDVALTSKLLNLVNSSYYGQFSNKGVSTISEAMIILGTKEIKMAAASLKIYEMMQNIATISILRDKTFKSLQRSLVARQIAIDEGLADAEELQISAMLYDFGEYLVASFAPQVFVQIEILMEENTLSREEASKSVIGVPYSKLGRYIASKWYLPPSIVDAMQPIQDFTVPKKGIGIQDFPRYICSFAYELCNIDLAEKRETGEKIISVTGNYESCLDLKPSYALKLLQASWEKIIRHATILKINLPNS